MNVTKGSTMKKMLLTGTMILALAGAGLQSARAGDREWATAGRVLTGVAVVGLIVAATEGRAQCSANYACSAPSYCPPHVAGHRAPVVGCPSHRFARHEVRHGCW